MGKNEIAAVGTNARKVKELPGRPMVRVPGASDEDLPARYLITDPKGDVVLLSGPHARAEHAAEALTDHLGRAIQVVYFFHHERHHLDTYGFALSRPGVRALTLPERAVVAAMVDYCASHRPGLRADVPVALPRVLQDESAIAGGYIYDFTDEARAYMLADVCEDLYALEAEVVDDANGWMVILRDDDGESITAERLAELQGVCRVLQSFTVEPSPMEERTEAPAVRAAMRTRKAACWEEMSQALADLRERCARIEIALTGAGDVLANS